MEEVQTLEYLEKSNKRKTRMERSRKARAKRHFIEDKKNKFYEEHFYGNY